MYEKIKNDKDKRSSKFYYKTFKLDHVFALFLFEWLMSRVTIIQLGVPALVLDLILRLFTSQQVRMLNTGSGKWPCLKTCNCFVLGQAAQECLLCTPVCLNICTLGLAMV